MTGNWCFLVYNVECWDCKIACLLIRCTISFIWIIAAAVGMGLSSYFCVFCVGLDHFDLVLLVLLGLVFSLLSQEIGGKKVFEMTPFVSSGTLNLASSIRVIGRLITNLHAMFKRNDSGQSCVYYTWDFTTSCGCVLWTAVHWPAARGAG